MKIRSDFVTNSSSSSFILARKENLTEQQKEVIVDYVCENLLGNKMLTPNSTEAEIVDFFENMYVEDEKKQQQIRQALKEGKTIYYGAVIFEETEYHYGNLFQELWEKLEDCDSGEFTAIDGDLDY
ncbi:MAG TPA: hypothetical protein IAB46_07075 [Candidatus Scybalocola faecigallinarum]|uniref:Uncharacterized protein n=1 Tax=Candidatus Scybalocola faecigallinarum TaxID=2840941 RepID=A0A9D1F4P6_9FIRM|nr:hypothetical protein [Candidatus Scybalocola faecigallinarum]